MAPAWLKDFQEQFSKMLRTPLSSRSGTFEPVTSAYDDRLCDDIVSPSGESARERLLIYNRQYWLRLFSALQTEYPLTSYTMGYWEFNHYVHTFLLRRAPVDVDLGRAGDGFLAFLLEDKETRIPVRRAAKIPREAVLQIIEIDAAWRRIFNAPEQKPWCPSTADENGLPKRRFEAAETFALIQEDWPLVAMRHALVTGDEAKAGSVGPRMDESRFWVFTRTVEGIQHIPIHSLQARLLRFMQKHSLEEALFYVESEANEEEREFLLAHVGAWLAQSIQLGFWCGVK